MTKKVPYLDLKQEILQKIKKNGGWVNAHAHLDRAFTITPEKFRLVNSKRHEKWMLNADVRKSSTVSQIHDRMAQALELLIEQGVSATVTFVDVTPDVKDKAIKAAQKVRDEYKSQIIIKYISLPIYGVLKKENREWFDIGADFADIIGGTVKTDAPYEAEHMDIMLEKAKSQKKLVHLHVDELNVSEEHETELLAKKTIEYGMEGKVIGIHGISINTYPKKKREEVYKLMKKAKMMMVACPMSWIDGWRSEVLTPTHNSITPADEMTAHGIPVAIGIDNLYDIFKPMNDGNMWNDLRLLMEANRWFDIDEIVKVATTNGRKALGIK
ncbi:MAG TPA: amidohydrolase family protein [Candidatus Saccharimonadales bacterium]|nr:amidohydrolase family protein [Candidatus Saccharimonadales bacterium]